MKKLIALILILVISSFIVGSKDGMSLEQRIETEKSKNPNLKNKKWEYVKYQITDNKIDLNLDYPKAYQEPLLLDIKNATAKDSLAVVAFMKNLKEIFPLKKAVYFSDFVGTDFETYQKSGKALKPIKESFDAVMSYSMRFSFDPKLQYSSSGTNSYDGSDLYPYMGSLRRDVWNMYNNSTRLIFGFSDEVSVEERRNFIASEFFRVYWKSYYKNFVSTVPIYSTLRQDQEGGAKYWKNNSSTSNNKSIDYVVDDAFLITKLFSADFIDQFKDYMYATYPWRYASSFINKEEHEIKVWGIIIGLGLLVFGLMFSYFHNRKYKYSYLNYLFPIFFILIYFMNITLVYSYLTSFNTVFILNWIFFGQILRSIIFSVIVSSLLWGLEKISFKGNKSFVYQLVLKVIFTFVSFSAPLALYMFQPDAKGLFVFILPYVFFSATLAIGRGFLLYLNHFSESLVKEKDVELSRLKEAKAEAEVKALQSQINPHFLYNALNSIAGLAHTDADKTEKMALSLSDLFRHSINRKGKKVNTLGDEITLVQNYLEIEQIRFGDRLEFSIDVEPDLLDKEIPMFILQPLVENAIKHGISKMQEQGKIFLKVSKKDNGILISVQDNGPDFPEGLVSGHGLQSVYDLLKLTYGDKAEISWHNEPKKEITIDINNIL